MRERGVCKSSVCGRRRGKGTSNSLVIAKANVTLCLMQADVLRLLSPRGVAFNSGATKLFLGSEGAVAVAEQLVLRDGDGKLQLLLQHNNHLIAASSIRVNNDRAFRFNSSIQAPYFTSVQPHHDHGPNSNGIRIESPSRATRLLGPKALSVRSSSGSVTLHAFRDLKFLSKSDRVSTKQKYMTHHWLLPLHR